MGFWSRLWRTARGSDTQEDETLWSGFGFASHSAAGIRIDQTSALSSATVYACLMMLSEDVAKLTPQLFMPRDDGGRTLVVNHWLAQLLRRPNEWQTGFEFRQMMMVQLLLRENAYAVIIRNRGGRPVKLIPVNSDRVALWEAPSGELFYLVTPLGLHEMAELKSEPFLIPAEDMLHLRGLSLNGLMGASRIVLHKEAIGLSIAQEQQQARWLGKDARPSGVLQTEQKLTKPAAERMAGDWHKTHSGLANTGKIVVLEQGLKYSQLGLTATDMDFINGRRFQLEELARLWRIPPHMIGVQQAGRGGAEGIVTQQASEYLNFTLTGHTQRWTEKLDCAFDIAEMGMFLDWDYSILTRADQATRYSNYSKGIAGGYLTPNEARVDDGRNPRPNGDKLWMPANVSYAGSQASGVLPDGGGRPQGSQSNEDA